MSMEMILLLFSALHCSVFFTNIIATHDTITPTLPLYDGHTLVSSDTSFELGFFTPGNSQSQNRYLGIWYNNISIGTVVWVANRETPLPDISGVLTISKSGNLVILNNRTNSIIWSSNNTSSEQTQNNNPVVAQLLNSGNLVLRPNNSNGYDSDHFIWQSFDYPCDIMLPGMKLGWNHKTGIHRFLSSWRTAADPSPGEFTYGVDLKGFPQLELKKGETVIYRAGSWNGVRFSGTPHLSPNSIFQFDFVYNREEVYYTYVCKDSNRSIVSQLVLNQSGVVQRFTWNDRRHEWVVYKSVPSDQCDSYGSCGAYGSCNIDNTPVCQCLDRFVPKSPEMWNLSNWADGCVRRTEIGCGEGVGFRQYADVKLPDTVNSVVNLSMSVAECEEECLKNCSCTAYAMANIKEGSGCLAWNGELIDIRALPDKGQDLFVKMAASELDKGKDNFSKRKRLILIFTCVPLFLGMLLLGLMMYIRKGKFKIHKSSKDDLELPMLDFVTITTATNNFSAGNKLGEGGFGPVFKGVLPDGQEIAVKRLSKNSNQGLDEFKNEVMLISKLQHRNLVKLLGCCIEGEEKMLVYEYLPNRSLDCFIFDQTRRAALDWGKRYDIICGIARGLLYLHQDSRLRIVHRDLKASNILLDDEMNPKISDFGLARPFGGEQSEANTGKVVGTYGYMAPEYAMHGFSSAKSDVFSFGVIALEIVSGKKNRGFYHPERNRYLLGHAWSLWKENQPLKLVDATIKRSFNESEVLRCFHVGLLCVQEHPDERPSMSSVILMLGSETANLPQPNHPGFYSKMNGQGDSGSSSKKGEEYNSAEVSSTTLEGR